MSPAPRNGTTRRNGLGIAFISEVDTAIRRASVLPRQFARVRRVPEVRRALTHRFPYRIYFICRDDALVVIRVLHSARHDREWKNAASE
jgi:plasmid stabilization system protein ParE